MDELTAPTQENSMEGSTQKAIFVCIGFAGVLIFLSFFVTPYMLAASLAYFMMVGGLLVRKFKNKSLHAKLMSSAMLLDVLIVLILEIQRSAINTAVSMNLSPLQMAHIGASSLATILYIPVFLMGYILWKKTNRPSFMKVWHLRLGLSAFVLRTLGFLLMFTLLSHVTRQSL